MKTLRLALSSAGVCAMVGCQELASVQTSAYSVPVPATDPPVVVDASDEPGRDPGLRLSSAMIRNLYSDTSCTGLGGDPTGGPITDIYNRGLRGKVTVPKVSNPNDSSWGLLSSFLRPNDNETLADTLFFGELNVPTRAFSAGFPKLGGGFVSNASGQKLIEYFRIDFDGYVELAPGMQDGDYDFALLADDGVELKLGANFSSYAKYEGVTPTKLICGDGRAVRLREGHTLPLKLAYFQGPRHHIALQLLWRAHSDTPDPACGQSGNDLWFDSNQTPSRPKTAYKQLLSRGWSVVPASAFRIPDDELMNPCRSDAVQEEFQDANPI
jgi:hypothetical protein